MPRPAPLQVHLQPIDLESGVRVMWDVGLLCADLSLPRPHLLIWKRRNYTYRIYSSKCRHYTGVQFNVITVVVFTSEIKIHLQQTPSMYNTDVAVFYYCLLSMNSIIILST